MTACYNFGAEFFTRPLKFLTLNTLTNSLPDPKRFLKTKDICYEVTSWIVNGCWLDHLVIESE